MNGQEGATANATLGEVRLRLSIAYDGTDFAGWARQPRLRTVQGELERALDTVLPGRHHRLTVAGRTDAGVHATGQLAHLDLTPDELAVLAKQRSRSHARPLAPEEALRRRINGLAGHADDLIVSTIDRAPEGFDARFSAVWRRYQYRVADDLGIRDPLQRHSTVWVSGRLDVEAMDAAARSLLGLHDFASFCKPRDGATTIRTLQSFGWHRDAAGVLVAEVQADAFCHSMVRALVGACVAVGEGRIGLDEVPGILQARERTNRFHVMPAKGLTLTQVGYPPDDQLAARAEQTRARRSE
ncbi:tRNA pseudouridine(38-40) synthase TruA [Ruicaihuangia caeni]|uniref:tRNA pseudouridine synthase A n=1 Tax=Ruicaihuangia caeni TaxID=3042517 RepID=A0AAW6TAH6_9MICO|nr:tRNA pseudouridine(38-40) synthase TruA [Klugiella sp. YN-L-19]MDI2098592.1 tRNA pseudouridine(38-40) synthase TruA [Klugiella sp. YN-L-19]